jgi:hypothetical protein
MFGSIKTSMTKEDSDRLTESELHVTTFQQGGQGAVLDTDVETMMNKAKTFAETVKGKYSVPYEALLADYRTLDLPSGPNFVDIESTGNAARLRVVEVKTPW